jgi:hypothetical protein
MVLNTAINPAVLSTAKNAVVTSIMIFITLIPLFFEDAPIRPQR